MLLESILPEIYTFLDFTNHDCRVARKKGLTTVTTHIGGEIPSEHPMPYNVYQKVSDYLKKKPEAIDKVIEFLNEELSKPLYDYKKVSFEKCTYTFKKGMLGKRNDLPYINVTIEL